MLAAENRVAAFYQGRNSSPTMLACLTVACYQHIGGGGEKGVGVLNRAVMLSPDGVNTVIAAHEMSHVELHERLGARGHVPQWFDEGLAVVVSNDPRYLAPDTAGGSAPTVAQPRSRCWRGDSVPANSSRGSWAATAAEFPCRRCRAAAW